MNFVGGGLQMMPRTLSCKRVCSNNVPELFEASRYWLMFYFDFGSGVFRFTFNRIKFMFFLFPLWLL